MTIDRSTTSIKLGDSDQTVADPAEDMRGKVYDRAGYESREGRRPADRQ